MIVQGPTDTNNPAGLKRSRNTVHLVRFDTSGGKRTMIEAHMPVGKGWQYGNNGALDWVNMDLGPNSTRWQSYEDWQATQHKDEVAAKREAEKKDKK